MAERQKKLMLLGGLRNLLLVFVKPVDSAGSKDVNRVDDLTTIYSSATESFPVPPAWTRA